ncbi:putative exosome complex subunit Rrp46 [Aspergillus tanneri]|uniref:Exosome non-catalytic core subunit rrp46 n=1 Tax=Aspergillus tanneri TaxID=1220188 RepID=A0A5M9MR43_9EURO|nr:uncharacterized protein ATNIH1004_006471 [Aspergillus tanneri]KAA8647770.1 hypothetical protein ATNIH1004_006471 [Aspergillus tanneri]
MVGPAASSLTPLARADGSASYKCPSTGSNILGSVNAPVELPGRRDALKPEEATVEVFVKPGTAAGGVGERYVEGIIKTLLGRLILGREKGYARRGVVLTLAIVGGESVPRGDSIIREPSPNDAQSATSLHVLAFSSKGHLLLTESQGAFDFDTWERVRERALTICHGTLAQSSDGDVAMAEDVDGQPLEGIVREAVEDKLHQDYAWKIDEA